MASSPGGFESGFRRFIPIKAGNLDRQPNLVGFCQNENGISDLVPSPGKTWVQGQLCSIFLVKMGSPGPRLPTTGSASPRHYHCCKNCWEISGYVNLVPRNHFRSASQPEIRVSGLVLGTCQLAPWNLPVGTSELASWPLGTCVMKWDAAGCSDLPCHAPGTRMTVVKQLPQTTG